MSAHRVRKRAARHPATVVEVDEDEVMLDELATLWPRLAAALERDTGTIETATADRRVSGGSKGSGAAVNLEVLEVAAVVQAGVRDIEAQAERILRLSPRRREVAEVIAALPDWRRALLANPAAGPLAQHLVKDAASWLRMVRIAIGLQLRDTPLGADCPDHRDDHPTPLLIAGKVGRLSQSAVGAPPPKPYLRPQPLKPRDDGEPFTLGDWVWRGERWAWAGQGPLEWNAPMTIRCPRCKMRWTGTECRLLVRILRALGDTLPNDALSREALSW